MIRTNVNINSLRSKGTFYAQLSLVGFAESRASPYISLVSLYPFWIGRMMDAKL